MGQIADGWRCNQVTDRGISRVESRIDSKRVLVGRYHTMELALGFCWFQGDIPGMLVERFKFVLLQIQLLPQISQTQK